MNGRVGAARRGGFMLDVEFAAPPGYTILFGASGSGKTTTLKAIAGLVNPDAGLIRVEEKVLFDSARRINLSIRERRAGYVFQNLALFPHLTALANIEFGMEGQARAERKKLAAALMGAFGIEHIAGRLPRHISGGEAQRVALARALASKPRLLLLDEPLSALDEATKMGIISDLKKIKIDSMLPVVYVTHSREEAFALGERVMIFESGRIVAEGEPEAVFHSPSKVSVARLTGVENIFRGRILERSERMGMMLVELEGAGVAACRIEVPLVHGGEERVTIGVRSGDMLLATEEPRGLSARNILAGRITAIEELSSQTLVRILCGVEWTSSVTKQSIKDLDLTIGQHVWLVFKTYSCRILEHED